MPRADGMSMDERRKYLKPAPRRPPDAAMISGTEHLLSQFPGSGTPVRVTTVESPPPDQERGDHHLYKAQIARTRGYAI